MDGKRYRMADRPQRACLKRLQLLLARITSQRHRSVVHPLILESTSGMFARRLATKMHWPRSMDGRLKRWRRGSRFGEKNLVMTPTREPWIARSLGSHILVDCGNPKPRPAYVESVQSRPPKAYPQSTAYRSLPG